MLWLCHPRENGGKLRNIPDFDRFNYYNNIPDEYIPCRLQ